MAKAQAVAVERELRPTDDRIVVRSVAAQTMSAGGLHIPSVAQDRPQEGEILAVGPGRIDEHGATTAEWEEEGKFTYPRIPTGYEVGQHVLFGKYSGLEIDWNGEKVIILKASDIMAVVE